MDLKTALKSARQTKVLESGAGVLSKTAEVFAKLFPGKKAAIVADRNTLSVAGAQVASILRKAGLLSRTWVFEQDEFHATFDLVEAIRNFLKTHEDEIAVAVGSGTINDLCKLSSDMLGRGYMCVATAASVDGYSSFGASITKDGSKLNIDCKAPTGIISDSDVLKSAPSNMTAAGYADLSAKIIAGADWIIADTLEVEKIDKNSWDIVQGGVKSALADPKGAREGKIEAITQLSNGLMLGGFAMQYMRSSRPASGSEHQFSHLWDMEKLEVGGTAPSHGFKVGIGTLCMTALYEEFLKEDFSDLDISKLCETWGTLDTQMNWVESLVGGTDFEKFVKGEVSDKFIAPCALKKQLELLQVNSDTLKERVKNEILPYEKMRENLKEVGAPVSVKSFGFGRERLEKSFTRAILIRSRFTLLDVGLRTGKLNKWVSAVLDKHSELFS